MTRRYPLTALGLSMLLAACVQVTTTDPLLTEIGVKASAKPKPSASAPGKPDPKASTPTTGPSTGPASPLPPAPTNLSADHKQLQPVVEEGLLAIAQVSFLQARSAIVGNNGSSLIGKIRLPGVISNNTASVIGNNGSSYQVAQAPETINVEAEAGEVRFADRHWPDGTATRQFTKDVKNPDAYIRRIEFGANGKPLYQFKQEIIQTYAVTLRPRVVEKATLSNYEDGQFRASYHYTEEYDAESKIAKLTFKKGNFREPFVALGLDIEEFTVDLATGRGTFRYVYSNLKKKEKGVLVDVKLNAQGKLDIDYNDPLAFFDGLSEVEDDKGKRLYTKRKKKKGGGKSTREFELDGGLKLVYEQEQGRQLSGVLTKDGKEEAKTTQETREDGTVISTVTFPEDPDRPVVVGFGLQDAPAPNPSPTPAPALPVVSTLAGGESGYVDGDGQVARFNGVRAIARSRTNPNRYYLADSNNHRIRVLTLNGAQVQVTTLAGSTPGFADGVGPAAQFNAPFGLAVAADDTLYVSEGLGHRIRKIAPDGTVTTLAGTGKAGAVDGNGTTASFNIPAGLALRGTDTLFVAEFGNHKIRRLDLGMPGVPVTTIAGSTKGFADGQGAAAQFNAPLGLALDAAGALFVADSQNFRIRKVVDGGTVTTHVGHGDPTRPFVDGPALSAGLNPPYGLMLGANGELLTAYQDLRTLSADGKLRTLAGQTASGFKDGSAKEAAFATIFGLAPGEQNAVLVAEGTRIRLVKRP